MAVKRRPKVFDIVKSRVNPVLGEFKVLDTEEWFQEDHGRAGGKKIQVVYGCKVTHQTEGGTFWPHPHHCRCRASGVRQGHQQADWHVSHLLDTLTLLSPVDANVVQTFGVGFQNAPWLTALAIIYARTSVCWVLSPSPYQGPLLFTKNAILGGNGRAVAPSAPLRSRRWRG